MKCNITIVPLVYVEQYVYLCYMKATCSKCSKPLEDNRVGKYRYCRSCHASNMRENRPKHSELTPEQRLKANCRAYTKVYIKRGKLIPQPCELCSNNKTEAHHSDYTKPLEVKWLCRTCHLNLHRINKM